jgi:homoserine kinase
MIRVRIPATTANLGPGFDCMGLALDLWNTFELYLDGTGYRVETIGEGSDVIPQDQANLTLSILLDELQRARIDAPSGIRIVCHNTVPCASGLGSSSTATLAGVLFGAAMVNAAQGADPSDLDFASVLARAVAIEGHGDNVAPALLGGFVIVVPDSSGVLTKRIPYVPIKTVFCVPKYAYLTTDARAALPATYSKADSIYNIGRAMLVAEALRSGDDELLARSMNDRIHEPYRLKSIPGAQQARLSALEAGAVCVALSGAGPGIVAFARGGYDRIGRAMKHAFSEEGLESRYWILDASENGAHVGRLPV